MATRSSATKTPVTIDNPFESSRLSTWARDLSGPDRDAAAALISMFESFGLGSLAPKIVEYVQQGYGAETMMILLQETKEYKERFAANEARRKAGLPVLSPAEYIATERAYAQALQAAGLPKGFYDDPAKDFRKFLEADVAPTEIIERANKAAAYVNTLDAHQLDVLQRRRGLGVGDLAAYYLDVDRALPLLERQVQTALLGAERERAGFSFSEVQAEMLLSAGVGIDQARQGYGVISQMAPTYSKLAEIEGVDFDVSDLEAEVFGSSGQAAEKRGRLASQERGRFSGRAGTTGDTLTRRSTVSY